MSWPVGERLRRIIDVVFGSSINAAGNAVGIDASTLFRVAEGTVTDPRLDTVRRLSEAFGVPTAWLLGDADSADAQRGSDLLPEWLWLLDTYFRRRERKLRDWLAQADGEGAEVKSLIAELSALRLFPPTSNTPLSLLTQVIAFTEKGVDEEIRLVRHLYRLQLEILELGVIKAWKLGATPKPPRSEEGGRSRRAQR